ncbi:hypothetical protein DYB34_007238 [Aphanomyces astaci]|uniref:glucan endo-1,3-beta-D-glucosidase n=1 Tax=Aphanomyces astaci TaxID=112090 RepID=A0A3R7AP00_APHAT|nr:hypothetical protein DYB34_007238 [Aphanomyces astaci]
MAPSTSYPSKHVCLILVVLSAVLSVDAAAGGVCFDVADVGNIDNHFRQIKTKFSAVRVYETQMGNTNAIAAAAKAGLQIAAGVWIRSGDAKIQADIDAVAAGIKAYPGTVVAVYVGNEDLANGVSEQTVINKVNQAKASLSALGVPIGSVQVDGDFLSAGRLADACDVVGVNIYPYFGSSPDSILKPINDLNARWKQVTAKFGGKAKLTETGWPTSGTYNGHVGSYDNAKAYWQSYSDWSYGNGGGVPFYFQHKDMPNKSPEFEANFGLIDIFTTQANATPIATASTAPGPEQRDPSLFNPKDSLDGVAMLEDRPSTMLDNMGDIRGSEVSLHGAGDDALASDEPAAFDNRTTMDLLDTARSSTEILL